MHDFSFLQTDSDVSDTNIYTFSDQSLGDAHSERYIIVGISGRSTSLLALSSVTIGGVTADIYVEEWITGATFFSVTGYAIAKVPTGTTGDIVVTFSGSMARCHISAYRAININPIPFDTAIDKATNGEAQTTLTADIDIPFNGFAISISNSTVATAPTATWSGTVEDFEDVVETTFTATGGSIESESGETAFAVTVVYSSSSGDKVASMISFGILENYTRSDEEALPVDGTDLATRYTEQDYVDVEADDETYVGLDAVNYAVHQFKKKHENDTDSFEITVQCKTRIAPTTYPVFLEIYNHSLVSWETLDMDDTTAIDTDFDLTADISIGLSDYYDESNELTFRIYQQQQEIELPPVSGKTPLIDLSGNYLTFPGRLYDGSNTRPSAHNTAGIAAAAEVIRRDTSGNSSPSGKIGLMSIGMSNTKQEFGAFMDHIDALQALGTVDNRIEGINAAQGGYDLDTWTDPDHDAWSRIAGLLSTKSMTAAQVQVIWLKQAHAYPWLTGTMDEFPEHALVVQDEIITVCQIALEKFPNLKQVFISSRCYSYTEDMDISPSPEPWSYEEGFGAKWAIQDYIDGSLTDMPWIAWGPYLWCNGANVRSDGKAWELEDVRPDDLTHPSDIGKEKVADWLEEFFLNDATTTPWFLA